MADSNRVHPKVEEEEEEEEEDGYRGNREDGIYNVLARPVKLAKEMLRTTTVLLGVT
jgi:hypothetical protein